jgi:hypothetical protein
MEYLKVLHTGENEPIVERRKLIGIHLFNRCLHCCLRKYVSFTFIGGINDFEELE